MYAIIDNGGKQYQVKEGDIISLEKIAAEEGQTVTLENVVLIGGDGEIKTGSPFVNGASVSANVLCNGRGKKITVFTYRPKKSSKRKMGHRQPFTKVKIDSIKA